MTAAIVGMSPNLAGTRMYQSGSLSQYMEDMPIFGSATLNPVMGGAMPFCGGVGLGQDYYDMMAVNSDNMTSLAFKQRSNQHVLGSYSEIMQKNLSEMATALRNGEAGKASLLYNEIYEAISKNYGEELTTHEQRVAFDQSVKATITQMYEKVNGYPLAKDIQDNGEGYFMNGLKQGLFLGNHHSNSAEEVESYMLGTGIEGYTGKQIVKTLGKLTGSVLSVGTMAGIGFAIGGPVGAAIGAAAGVGITVLSKLFAGDEPTKVTKAF